MPTKTSIKLDLIHRIEAVAVIASRLLENREAPTELAANIGKLQDEIANLERQITDLPERTQKRALLSLPVESAIAKFDPIVPHGSQMDGALFSDIMEVRNGLIFIKETITDFVTS